MWMQLVGDRTHQSNPYPPQPCTHTRTCTHINPSTPPPKPTKQAETDAGARRNAFLVLCQESEGLAINFLAEHLEEVPRYGDGKKERDRGRGRGLEGVVVAVVSLCKVQTGRPSCLPTYLVTPE